MGGHIGTQRRRRRLLLVTAGAAIALLPSVLTASWTPTGREPAATAALSLGAPVAHAPAASAPAATPAHTPAGSRSAPPDHHQPPTAPLSFNRNLFLPASSGLAEPSIRTRSDGTALVAAPAGAPGGCRLIAVAHDGASARFLDNPDSTVGGGDCELTVGPKQSSGTGDQVAVSSAYIVNFTTASSDNGGASFATPDVFSQQVPIQDRAWMAADPALNALGRDDIFMAYHDVDVYELELGVSVDGGQTYVQSSPLINPADVPTGQWALACPALSCEAVAVGGAGNTGGNLVAQRRDGRLTLYSVFVTPDSVVDNLAQGQKGTANYNRVYEAIGTVVDAPVPVVTWHDHEVYHGPVGANYGNIFPATAVDGTGRVYTTWADGVHVEVKSDATGSGWDPAQAPTAVDVAGGLFPATSNTATFPWIAAGPHGADLVWYSGSNGTTTAGDPNDPADAWNVYLAQTTDGGARWQVARVSDHVIHRGGICGAGDTCNPLLCAIAGGCQPGNRTLLDFFQVSVDPTDGAADIAWADDHDTPGTPALYFSRQCTGPSLTTGKALHDDCIAPPPPGDGTGTSCPGPQVVDDDPGDAIDPQPGSTGAEMPSLDVVATSYATTKAADGTPLLRVTITLDDLEPIPPSPDVPNAWWTAYWSFAGTTWYAQATAVATTSSAGRYLFSDGSFVAPFGYHPVHGGATGGLNGTVTPGRNGSISIDVPLADFGAAAGDTVTATSADTRVVDGLAGGGIANNVRDRAPDVGAGAGYTIGGAC
jgi:hypothetical protein